MAAAYAALVSLSQIIHQILHPPPPHHFLIPTEQIQSLQDHVNGFIDVFEKYSTPETEDLEKRIVGAAYEAEDIIESCVVSQIQAKYNEIRKLLPIHKVLKKKTVIKLIENFISIREEVENIRIRKGVEDMGPHNPTAASSSRSVPGGKNLMIGFDEHLIQVKTALATDEFDLQIIPVVGMGGIGSLDKLEVLKLKDYAFTGQTWEATDGGFRHLEVLHIGQTDLKIWLASHHHFPRLKHLQLNNCKYLQQVPIELADVPSFQKLDLFRCAKRAAASAKRIKEKIKENNQQPGNVVRRFRLSIFPPGD